MQARQKVNDNWTTIPIPGVTLWLQHQHWRQSLLCPKGTEVRINANGNEQRKGLFLRNDTTLKLIFGLLALVLFCYCWEYIILCLVMGGAIYLLQEYQQHQNPHRPPRRPRWRRWD